MPATKCHAVSGILNGTCNYILSRMEQEGLGFAEVLADAQSLGYAEADPTFDVGGFDTAHKLAILTSLAFGTQIDAEAIHVEGISAITPLDLKMATNSAIASSCSASPSAPRRASSSASIRPWCRNSPIAQVMGVTNAVASMPMPSANSRWSAPARAARRRRPPCCPISSTSRAARACAVRPARRHA